MSSIEKLLNNRGDDDDRDDNSDANKDDNFTIIEKGEDVLKQSVQQQNTELSFGRSNQLGRTIDERLINNYYLEEYISLEKINILKQIALKSGLRSYRFRSIAWSIFLGCIPDDRTERIERIRSLRNKYVALKDSYRQDPRLLELEDKSISNDNPLSQDESSHWNRYFSDDELQTRIRQDVIRAFPDINFFQSSHIQEIMINILFNFARENPQIEYKQGMHEILAPIIFVIHSDHQSYLFSKENGLIDDEIEELMDSNYIEHDSYVLFSQVMERIESWYDNNSLLKTTKKHEFVSMEPFSNDLDFNCYSKIGIKLKMITEQILRRHDEELFIHLRDLKIAPQIFGIRWMRLLFIREFQMQDLLVLWDAIFANDFTLCDFIFTSMLVVIRSLLLPFGYADCLNHLMRYPSVCDVHYVIHLALHFRDPLKYPEPIEHSTLVLPNPKAIKAQMANRFPESLDLNPNNHRSNNKLSRSSPNGNSNGGDSSLQRNSEVTHSFDWIEDKFGRSSKINLNLDVSSKTIIDDLKQQIEKLNHKKEFCAHYMTKHLEILQTFINQFSSNQNFKMESDQRKDFESQLDNALISIAEMKKIRDILRGTLTP
ncbi:hypothetical protein SSS_08460 [Sarcoptes scabiei]|uniref:TBC1 domain family member 5 n=1 Tax=Sarcoptes scabiei TaxID=52283 RepID=A0A834RB44_SARSC|nr:hypothetical protein SSS_08460 [Sarcoptes scabiei]